MVCHHRIKRVAAGMQSNLVIFRQRSHFYSSHLLPHFSAVIMFFCCQQDCSPFLHQTNLALLSSNASLLKCPAPLCSAFTRKTPDCVITTFFFFTTKYYILLENRNVNQISRAAEALLTKHGPYVEYLSTIKGRLEIVIQWKQ